MHKLLPSQQLHPLQQCQLLESNQTDPPHFMIRKPNPWKPGSSRCSNTASLLPFPTKTKSSSQHPSSRIRLHCGGDLTTNPLTGPPLHRIGRHFLMLSDS